MSKVQDKLPSGWAEATIEDIFETLEDGRTLHQGWSPQCESFPSQDEKVWGALRTTAIQAGRFCPEHNKQLPAHLAPRPVIEVKAGDILLTCAGPRSRCGIACLVRNTRKRLMISGKMYRFRVPEKEIDARYVEAYLQTTAAQMAIDAMKTGGSDSGLNLTHERFRPLRIPIAPRNEQQRIADTLDELLSDLDAGGDALHSAKAKLALYRASVLKAAVQGDLTAEWRKQHPDAEPATELLKRILKERRQRWEQEQLRKFADASKTPPANWKAKYKEPITPDKTNLPKLPKDWCWVSLDALLREQLRNGHSSKATLSGDGVPTFTLSAVTYGDFSDSNIKFTSANPAKVTDLWVQPDDIFIERSNTPELVGTARHYKGEPNTAIFPDLLIRVRTSSLVLTSFIAAILQANDSRRFFQARAQGVSGSMPKIDQSVIESLPVPLCSLEEQAQIMESLDDQMSVLDHLEVQISEKNSVSRAIRQSVLHHAFTGKLAPQDPNDELASELLKRIAIEREKSKKQKAPHLQKQKAKKQKRVK